MRGEEEEDEGLKFKGVIMMKPGPMGFGTARAADLETTLPAACGAPAAPLGQPWMINLNGRLPGLSETVMDCF